MDENILDEVDSLKSLEISFFYIVGCLMISFKMWVHKSDMYWWLKYDTIQHRIRLSKLDDIECELTLTHFQNLVCVKSCGFPNQTR